MTFLYISLVAACLFTLTRGDTIAGQCPRYEQVTQDADAEIGIFDDLTALEMENVASYMKQAKCFNINDSPDIANVSGSYIYLMELKPPKKSEALVYLEERGPKPGRFARVILYRGAEAEPVIEEYEVGPLPIPTSYTLMKRPHWRHPIPYSVRSPFADADTAAWQEFICRELTKVSRILETVTGHSFSPDCLRHCLTYRITMPGRQARNDRSVWVIVERRYEGSSLYPIGLEFRVNINATCPCQWNIDSVWFRSQSFANMEDLVNAYHNNITVKKRLEMFGQGPTEPSYTEYENETLTSKEAARDPTTHQPLRRGPRCYVPDGRRFVVDGRQVRWLSWRFNFNIRTTTGPHLNDIRFDSERIAYELSLQEMLILSGGESPGTAHSALIQSVYLLGSRAYELYADVDCPPHGTVFVDFVHYVHRTPTVYRRAACIFEESRGAPLRRRRYRQPPDADGKRARIVDGAANNCLVVRSVIVTGHYEYIVDFVFHQNGVIETTCSATGYLATHFYTGQDEKQYGFQVSPQAVANVHNHLANFKIDLDICGTANRVEHLEVKMSTDTSKDGGKPAVRYFERVDKENENAAAYKIQSKQHKIQLFSNANCTNRHGHRRSYRLNPTTTSKLLLHDSDILSKAFSWAKYQIAVTKRKDDEDTSSTVYNAMDHVEPVLDFERYLLDNDRVLDEDIVAWVTVGAMVIPHSEDIPVVQTSGPQMSFFLLPFNYFDTNPSHGSLDTVIISDARGRSENDDVMVGSSPECKHVLVRKSGSLPRVEQNNRVVVVLLILACLFYRAYC